MKKIIFLLLFLTFLLGCGKKGPLRPLESKLSGVKEASFTFYEGRVLIRAVLEDAVNFFSIERIELSSDLKEPKSKIIYEGVEKNISFIDKNIDPSLVYEYKIIPILKNGKVGKVFVSSPINVPQVNGPTNLVAEVLETVGSVSLFFEGAHCSSFAIYRYPKNGKKPKEPYVIVKTKFFVDETPIHDVEMVYEVSCIQDNKESINNPRKIIKVK